MREKQTAVLRSSLLWDVTLGRVVVTDVSGQPNRSRLQGNLRRLAQKKSDDLIHKRAGA